MALFKRNKRNDDIRTISIDKVTYMKLYIYADERGIEFTEALEELLKK